MDPLLVIPGLYGLYLVYLLLAGAGRERTHKVLGQAALYSAFCGVAVATVAALITDGGVWSAFSYTMILVSIFILPTFTLMHARDAILPRSSALEVVCLNAMVLVFGHPPSSFPIVEDISQVAYQVLLNPFASSMPPWLGFALSFWPSVLALRLASRGNEASTSLRFFLNLWVQLMSVVWVLPAALGTFRSFKGDSWLAYLEALSACFGLIYVMMTWVLFHDSDLSRRLATIDPSFKPSARVSFPQAFAAGMTPGRWPPLYIAIAGVCASLLIWTVLAKFMSRHAGAAAIAFVFVVALSAALGQGTPEQASTPAEPDAEEAPRAFWISWPISAVLLIAVLTALKPHAEVKVGKEQRAAWSLDEAETRYPKPVTAIEASARPCEFEDFGDFVVRCRQDSRVLENIAHPAGAELPAAIFAQDARDYSLQFGEQSLNCIEIPARIRDENNRLEESIFLLIYVPNAVSALQYAWVVDIEATCRRVAELTTEKRKGFGYLWHDTTAATRAGYRMAWLYDFPLAEPASGQEQRAEP